MALPITIPNTFANATTSIPLANLDANFVTVSDAINGIGNGSENLANVSITGGQASNVLLQNRNREYVTIDANGAANTINFDVNTQQVLLYQGNATANVTVNIRGDGSTTLDTVLANNESITAAFGMTSNATAYYVNLVQIDGANVTPLWQGATPSGGTANSTEIYVFNAIKTGANTYTVFASVTAFV